MDPVGIDGHKKQSQIYILAEGGELIEQRIRTEPDRFAAVLGARPRARILIEASIESEWVARCLERLGHEVIVADHLGPAHRGPPRQVRRRRRPRPPPGRHPPCPHARTKARSPQTNGICERFHETVLKLYRVAFRKTLYTTLEQLQADLDAWLREYNELRPHQGRWCYGKTPSQTFLDTVPVAKDKLLVA